MSGKHKVDDIVYYDDNRVTVLEGPFRRDGYPNVDQYKVVGPHGGVSFAWGSDLLTEEEYAESLAELTPEDVESGEVGP